MGDGEWHWPQGSQPLQLCRPGQAAGDRVVFTQMPCEETPGTLAWAGHSSKGLGKPRMHPGLQTKMTFRSQS